jgi:hypothetical protein
MRRGDMILIDELNLAEDAVLERLNRRALINPAAAARTWCHGAAVQGPAAPGAALFLALLGYGRCGAAVQGPAAPRAITMEQLWKEAEGEDCPAQYASYLSCVESFHKCSNSQKLSMLTPSSFWHGCTAGRHCLHC